MSEALIKTVQDMLNEEKWTRATILDYSTKNFEALDELIDKVTEEHCIDEVKNICDEHLSVTKDSIIALYISGILSLKKQLIDDSAMVKLINIFSDKPNKGEIIEYICKSILKVYPDSKLALRKLVDYYNSTKEKDEEEVLDIWKKLVQVDYEEAEMAKHIAEKFEKDYNESHKDSDKQLAIEYYTKAMNRYIAKQMEENIDILWNKLVELRSDDIDFFYHLEKKIAKSTTKEKAAKLLTRLYDFYRKKIESIKGTEEEKNEEMYWDWCIEILKRALGYDENDAAARKSITECYEGKYKNHSQLQKCINSSDLKRNYRNVFEAIADFEKRIVFDKGNYVYHRTWGVGKITSADNNMVEIMFFPTVPGGQSRKQTMTLDMAVSSLQVLSKKHIWVIKSCCSAKSIADKIKDVQKPDEKGKKLPKPKDSPGTKWILKTIIQSFDNNCDMKKIKEELVPSILSPSEWTTWSTKARKILNTDSTFAVNPTNMDMYQVRQNLSTEEKLYNEFKAQKDFFARLKTLDNYVFPTEMLAKGRKPDLDSDYFTEMFEYFFGYQNNYTTANELTMASYLEIERILTDPDVRAMDLQNKYGFTNKFTQMFETIQDINELYSNMKNSELRKIFLQKIKALIPNWQQIYIDLFPVVLSQDIVTALEEGGCTDELVKLVEKVFDSYRDYRESAIWFFKNCRDKKWFKEVSVPYEKMLIILIRILDITYREMENHFNTVENRKINKQIQNLLFTDGLLEQYMMSKDEDTAKRLFTLVDDIKDLEPSIKLEMRSHIAEKFKGIKFFDSDEKNSGLQTSGPKGLVVTTKKYAEKKEELEQLKQDILSNTKDISTARELGDLKENAEYKAAKEREAQLNSAASKLQDEIDKAVLFDPSNVNTKMVSFGTRVHLKNEKSGEEEVYTILGPWESDPSNGIISYMAPFGKALINHKKGEKLDFEINENKNSYTILEIEKADF